MRRRDFIVAFGTAVAWPLAARAQRPALPVVGFLRSGPLAEAAQLVSAFRDGLKDAGFVEGQNVAVEYHSPEGDNVDIPSLLADLIHRPAAVIVGNTAPALAIKTATTTVPFVFVIGNDPVELGLVPSLNRPGGNITGVFFLTAVLSAKRLELLRELVPQTKILGMVVDPNTNGKRERGEALSAAAASGLELLILDASTDAALDSALSEFARRGVGAVVVGSGAFTLTRRKRIVALAQRYRLPVSYAIRQAVNDGGLMSYGPSLSDAYRQAGIYAGRILKGEKPADLPVIQSTKFELVINLKTAKALGLDVPPTLLAIADEVIE